MGRFSRRMPFPGSRSLSKIAERQRALWQRRHWEHLIRDEADLRAYVECCWIDPVTHGLVARAADSPWSSFHRDVRRGIVPADFGGRFPDSVHGEPVAFW